MRKLTAIGVAVAMLAMAGTAMAADTNTLTVSASVTGTCKFDSATSTLDFGALDPSDGSNVSGSTSTTFWCTKGVTTDAVTAGNGSYYDTDNSTRRMAGPGGDRIPYTLTLGSTTTSAANAGPSSPRTLTIAGNILGSAYTNVTAGDYSDTVTLNIAP